MKITSINKERDIESKQDNDILEQKKAVAEQYKRLMKVFDCYFPHMPVPRIVAKPAGQCFYIKIQILDTVIEMEKVYRRLYPALHSILQVGVDFVERYGMFMIKTLKSDDVETENRMDGALAGTVHFADKQNSDAADYHVSKEKHTSPKKTNNSETVLDGCIDSIYKEFQERGENTETFYGLVKKHCTSRGICLPEYVIEKQNGVFMCRAEFLSETFTSRYAYSKDDVRENVFQMIYKFINEKEKHHIHKDASTTYLQHQDNEVLEGGKVQASDETTYRMSDAKKVKRKKIAAVEGSSCIIDTTQNTTEHVLADDCILNSPLFTEIRRDESSGCLLYANVHEKRIRKSQSGERESMEESKSLHRESAEMSAKKTFGFGDIFDSE